MPFDKCSGHACCVRHARGTSAYTSDRFVRNTKGATMIEAHCTIAPSSEPARHQVDDRVDRYPGGYDEIPVQRVLARVDEAALFERTGEHEDGQHGRVRDVGHE